MSNQLQILIQEGKSLQERGISIETDEGLDWNSKCNKFLKTQYHKNSPEHKSFKGDKLTTKIMVLETLYEKETKNYIEKQQPSFVFNINQIQSQITSVKNDISLQILLNIDHSNLLPNEKEEIKDIFNEVKNECEKTETNWDKVKSLLKKSFDYGLKIAPDIVKLADAYYRAKM